MHYAHLTAEVRQHTRRRLEDLGAEAHAELIETILIRDGYYCGRRFECDGLSAVWFVEEGQVKFYQRDGSVVTTCTVDDLFHSERRQAA
jgi:hypothetical protein